MSGNENERTSSNPILVDYSNRKSITRLLGDQYETTGHLLMDEVMIYGTFYQKKMLEYNDRNEIINIARKAVKFSLISIGMIGIYNRLLTKLKFKKFDFLNLRIFLKLPIRLSGSLFILYFGAFIPVFSHALDILDKINEKYYKRFEIFRNNGDPLIMNPGLLDEPGYTEEERANTLQFVENIRMQQQQMKMQEKLM